MRKFALWSVLCFVAVQYGASILGFVLDDPQHFDFRFRAKFLANLGWLRWHGVLGAAALVLGPLQLSDPIRLAWPRFHKVAGIGYSLAVLLSAPGALRLALLAEGGLAARLGFVSQGVLWLVTLALAWIAIRRHQWTAHRVWMLRNYALTLAAVNLRISLSAFQEWGWTFDAIYPWLSWGTWMFNLTLLELWLRGPRGLRWTAESTQV